MYKITQLESGQPVIFYLENEKVNQAANTLMYNGLVSITNIKLTMSKSVITGR